MVTFVEPFSDVLDEIAAADAANVAEEEPRREGDEVQLLRDIAIDATRGLGVDAAVRKGHEEGADGHNLWQVGEADRHARDRQQQEQGRKVDLGRVKDLSTQTVSKEEVCCEFSFHDTFCQGPAKRWSDGMME